LVGALSVRGLGYDSLLQREVGAKATRRLLDDCCLKGIVARNARRNLGVERVLQIGIGGL